MGSKIKIIFCTDGIFPQLVGGMQRHSRLLIEELAKNPELELIIVHPHAEKVFDPAFNIREISLRGKDKDKNYLMESYRYSKRVYNVIRKFDDALIYSQGLSVWYKIEKIGHRLVLNPHGLEPFQGLTIKDNLIGIPFRQVFTHLFEHARYVVSLGGNLTKILQANISDPLKIVELANAVSKPSITENDLVRPDTKPLQALFVSRFAANKGIPVLMQAISELNEAGYEDAIRFCLAGKGPLYEQYASANIFNNVDLPGFITDEQLENLYKTSHLFILPTLFEGMPTVVLEAMARGLPIIVSDVGATAELVDGSNGYLIEKNNVEELKQAIIHFTGLTAERRNELGRHSLQKINERFTWDKVSEQHVKVFRKLADEVFIDNAVISEY